MARCLYKDDTTLAAEQTQLIHNDIHIQYDDIRYHDRSNVSRPSSPVTLQYKSLRTMNENAIHRTTTADVDATTTTSAR